MTAVEHTRYLAIGFGIFAGLLGFTFLLLMLVSLGVFVALGISFANETGDANQAGVGILGGAFALFFYLALGLLLVLPTAVASRKLWKRRPNARIWTVISAILIVFFFPVGTFLAIYALWFCFSAQGRDLFLSSPATV